MNAVWATYGDPCAATMDVRSFLFCGLPGSTLPAGAVVALANLGVDDERCMKYWSNAHHLIGKDILTTHTVYWPTMLKAIGLEPPKTILAHGWWLIGRDKMSKSLGNVVNPMEMADKYGVDAFRYFLLSEMTLGQDAAFSEEAFVKRYNSDLANDLGNMLNRAVKLIVRYFDSKVPAPGNMLENEDKELLAAAADAADAMEHAVRNLHLDKGIETVMNVVRKANRYMETTAPWTLAKEGKTERLASVLYTAAETLRVVAQLLLPVMPEKMTKLLSTIGAPAVFSFEQAKNHGVLNPGSAIRDIDALFPRIQIEEAEAPKAEPKKKTEKVKAAREEPVLPEGIISITDFAKVKLITAKVVQAEKVPDAEKLLKLQVDAGSEKRQIVSGIAGFYTPEELIGKTIVLVANLKPAKIRGVESYGMLLAAKNGDNLRLVTVDAPDFPGGASVG